MRYSLLKPLDVVGLFGIKPIPRITPAKYKEEFSFLKEVDSLALANVQLQLEKAFRNHLKNPKHFGL